MRLAARLIATLALASALVGGDVTAAEPPEPDVDLELVLLADATNSIDDQEIAFQRRGYASALSDPAVLDAIARGAFQRIAVTYVEFADAASQDVVVDWTVIDGAETAEDFVRRMLAAPRRARGSNAIGAALIRATELIETNAHHAWRRVIDLSADSANNWNGPPIGEGRRQALAAGITINGLAVLCRGCISGRPVDYDLETAFAERIIGGVGAFVVTADGDAAFAEAVRRKLILEISGPAPGRGRALAAATGR